MTDRFSQEYIKFVSESKPIQAYWRKRGVRVGDWVATALNGALLTWLVVEVRGWGVFAKPSHWHDPRSVEHFLLPDDAVRWLPTLSDLLEGLRKIYPVMELNIYPEGHWVDDSEAHIAAATESVSWYPDGGGGFFTCDECGELHTHADLDGVYVTMKTDTDLLLDDHNKWLEKLRQSPVCPHCAEERAKTLELAAARLFERVLEKEERDE